MALPDGVFELDGYKFGGSGAYPAFVQKFSPGTTEWRNQDVDNPHGHNIIFGRDYMRPPTWIFDFGILAATEPAALAVLETLATKWRMSGTSTIPGKESIMKYGRGGRTRFVYGRPRRFDFDPQPTMLRQGATVGLAEFKLSDAFFYDELEQATVPLRLFAPPTGGFTFPFTTPITTVATSTRPGIVPSVGGTVNTPFKIIITGPVTNPFVTGDGWKVGLNYVIPVNRSVTINTRNGSVTLSTGANLHGFLTHDTRMQNARLRPGPDEFVFGGTDPTATATATIRWNSAYNSL